MAEVLGRLKHWLGKKGQPATSEAVALQGKESKEKIYRAKVAVDLDNTLNTEHGSSKLRAGALDLLEGLQERSLGIVLYSYASEEVITRFIEENHLQDTFCRVVTDETMPKFPQDEIERLEQSENQKDQDKAWIMGCINREEAGGKDPNLVDAICLIGDSLHHYATEVLDFEGIEIPIPEKDPSDSWVEPVLARVDEILQKQEETAKQTKNQES